MKSLHTLTLSGLAAGALFFSACGDSGSGSTGAKSAKAEFPEAPDAAMKFIAAELSKGNGGILWQAMPTSYQGDVNEIVQLASTKLDADVYNQGFGLIKKLSGVVADKKDFIINTSIGGEAKSAEEKSQMEAAWPAVVSFLNTFNGSQITSLEGLKAFDGQAFFDSTVSELLKQIDGIAAISGDEFRLEDLAEMAVNVVESTEDTATLEVSVPGEEVDTGSYKKVDGRWLSEEMVTGWADGVSNAKESLAALTPEDIAKNKPQIIMAYGMVDGILTNLQNAETQEQFDQALQGAMMPLMGLMMMGGGGLNFGAPSVDVPELPQVDLPTSIDGF